MQNAKPKVDNLFLYKGTTVNALSSHPQCKDGNVRFTTVPLKPLSDKNVVFRTRKLFILWVSPLLLINKKCTSLFHREPENENKQFKETKRLIPNSFLSRQSFQGCRFKSGGSLEITLTD